MHGSGHPVSLPAINCVLLGCANIWDADRAYQTFEAIGSIFGLRPDVHSINALLDAFGKNRKVADIFYGDCFGACLSLSTMSWICILILVEVPSVMTTFEIH